MLTSTGRVLIVVGISLAMLGGLLLLSQRAGLPRLPGDFVVRRGNFTLFVPLGTSLLLSVVLSLILSLLLRRR